MPVFSYTSPNLEQNGAIIDVNLYPSLPVIQDLQSKKLAVPTKRLIGLIDTGASCCAFDSPIAKELGLIVRDKQTVLTPSGESDHFLYDIVIFLGSSGDFIPTQAFGTNFQKQPFDIIIGRDVLKACTLVFNGWNNSYDLHLHQEKIIY